MRVGNISILDLDEKTFLRFFTFFTNLRVEKLLSAAAFAKGSLIGDCWSQSFVKVSLAL